MSPMRQTQKAPSPENIIHQTKTNEKQHVITGRAPAMVIGSQCLIPGAVAGVIGLLHALQDDIHCPKMLLAVRGS
jgi:hypothetical protein